MAARSCCAGQPRNAVAVPEEPITVLLVDDHPMVRRGLRDFLTAQRDIEVVAEAASATQALQALAEHAPDVALVDLVLLDRHGVELIRELTHASPRTRIVVLTSYQDDQHLFPALQAGALSYLLKDIEPDQLVAAVRRAFAGEAVLHPQLAACVIRELTGPRAAHASPSGDLTTREREVLRLIADGRSNANIAQQVVISEKTVKSHVSNILAKLQLADRTQAAAYAWKTGIAGLTG